MALVDSIRMLVVFWGGVGVVDYANIVGVKVRVVVLI